MGIRSTVASVIGGDAVDSRMREMVEEVLAAKGYVRPADLQALREEVAALRKSAGASAPPAGPDAEKLEALDTELTNLRKKLNMALGAIQAATAQLADVRRAADEARADALRALNRAESALATAESLSDGMEALEEAVGHDARVDVNTAGVDALEGLDGIGEAMARRIVDEREANGPFASLKDLERVKGLGAAKVAKLADVLRV